MRWMVALRIKLVVERGARAVSLIRFPLGIRGSYSKASGLGGGPS